MTDTLLVFSNTGDWESDQIGFVGTLDIYDESDDISETIEKIQEYVGNKDVVVYDDDDILDQYMEDYGMTLWLDNHHVSWFVIDDSGAYTKVYCFIEI